MPTEEEIDQLIAGSGKKLSTFLQLLKETGMRYGEAIRLEWINVDFKAKVVRVKAEKGSHSRILPISSMLIAMLNNLPKTSLRIWPGMLRSMKFNLEVTRARFARKLGNPRLKRISFHSLRHWKGTMEYHKTKDIIHIQWLLGHRDVKSTMLYINIENAIYFHGQPEEFHVKVAHSLDEACKLLEVGFELRHRHGWVQAVSEVEVAGEKLGYNFPKLCYCADFHLMLLLPLLHRNSKLLLNLRSMYSVHGAERNDFASRHSVMYTASLNSFQVEVVGVHEVHG
ncbi:hypothetical protein DRO69_02465 [Candidatus Bathyarchaeota archaeon]|nr:MAG: hypothetical protein DRO69_02465 [Candidatus Bathyarchaeota archaeon]